MVLLFSSRRHTGTGQLVVRLLLCFLVAETASQLVEENTGAGESVERLAFFDSRVHLGVAWLASTLLSLLFSLLVSYSSLSSSPFLPSLFSSSCSWLSPPLFFFVNLPLLWFLVSCLSPLFYFLLSSPIFSPLIFLSQNQMFLFSCPSNVTVRTPYFCVLKFEIPHQLKFITIQSLQPSKMAQFQHGVVVTTLFLVHNTSWLCS